MKNINSIFKRTYENENIFLQKKIVYLIYGNHLFILTFFLFTLLNFFTTDYLIAGILGIGSIFYLLNYFLIYKKKVELAVNITLLLPMLVVGIDLFLAKNDSIIGFHIAYRGTVSFFTMMIIMALIAVKKYQPILISLLSIFIIITFYFMRFYNSPNNMDIAVIVNIVIHYILAGSASFLILYLTEDLLNLTQEKSNIVLKTNDKLKKSYNELSIEKEKQTRLLAALPDLIIIHDYTGKILDYSLTNPELIHFFQKEFNQKSLCDFLPKSLCENTKKILNNMINKSELKVFHFDLEKNGKKKYFESRINPLNEKSIVLIIRDISEKIQSDIKAREAEERIFHSSKLATLGELSAGIAHEINQPLNYLKGVFHIFEKFNQSDIQINEKLKKYIPNSIHSLERINDIVSHLRDFVRNQETKKDIVDLNMIINNSLIFFKEKMRLKNIRLSITQKDTKYYVKANQNRMEQVFVNLFQNSIDALEPIEKEEKNIHINIHKDLEKSLIKSNSNITISFSDNGIGINKTIKEKVFEPFFTTKKMLNGTGLGLSIVSTIIEEHGGSIDLSEKLTGTEFIIQLPGK